MDSSPCPNYRDSRRLISIDLLITSLWKGVAFVPMILGVCRSVRFYMGAVPYLWATEPMLNWAEVPGHAVDTPSPVLTYPMGLAWV